MGNNQIKVDVKVEPLDEEELLDLYDSNSLNNSEHREATYECNSDNEMQLAIDEEAMKLSKILATTDSDIEKNLQSNDTKIDYETEINDILNKYIDDNRLKLVNIFYCKVCTMEIEDFNDFRQHVIDEHPDPRVYSFKFDKMANKVVFKLYFCINNQILYDLKCYSCHTVFKKKSLWLSHYLLYNYTCEKCGLCFSRCKLLYKHKPQCKALTKMDLVHSYRNIIISNCLICSRLFSTEQDLNEHMSTVHIVSSRYFMDVKLCKCSQCKAKYPGVRDVHDCPKRENKIYCTHCKKAFQSSLLLRLHMKANATPDGLLYKCATQQSSETKKHECDTDCNVDIYKCLLCFTVYEKLDCAVKHIIDFHKLPSKACNICLDKVNIYLYLK